MFTGQLLLPLVVIGLILGALLLPGLKHRFQQNQLARDSIRYRMEADIRRVEQALEVLADVPLDLHLRQALRRDVRDRYRMIGEIFPGRTGFAKSLQASQVRLDAEGTDGSFASSEPADEAELNKRIYALDDLSDYFEMERTLHPLSVHQRRLFTRYLGERAADMLATYHHARFAGSVEEDELEDAQSWLIRLIQLLDRRGPDTERVRELRAKAELALRNSDPAGSEHPMVRRAS